jgi:hypothetical protein
VTPRRKRFSKDAALDKIHRLAVQQWSRGTADGWLKIMQLSDPELRSNTCGQRPDETHGEYLERIGVEN